MEAEGRFVKDVSVLIPMFHLRDKGVFFYVQFLLFILAFRLGNSKNFFHTEVSMIAGCKLFDLIDLPFPACISFGSLKINRVPNLIKTVLRLVQLTFA